MYVYCVHFVWMYASSSRLELSNRRLELCFVLHTTYTWLPHCFTIVYTRKSSSWNWWLTPSSNLSQLPSLTDTCARAPSGGGEEKLSLSGERAARWSNSVIRVVVWRAWQPFNNICEPTRRGITLPIFAVCNGPPPPFRTPPPPLMCSTLANCNELFGTV